MTWLDWVRRHDRNLAALRRGGRAAIVMPIALYVGLHVIGNTSTGLFAAFGAFSMLLLADYTGPLPQRLQAEVALGIAGAVLVCLGTLASAHAWLAAVGMFCVGLPILFAGVVSSMLAGSTTSLLLAYILPACVPGTASEIPERLAGWGVAAVLSVVAVAVLWPTPTSDPLREPAARSMRLLAGRIRQQLALTRGGPDAPTVPAVQEAIDAAEAAVTQLRQGFLAATYRPTGLNTVDRTIVRLVDELQWLAQVVRHKNPADVAVHTVSPAVVRVRLGAADVLEHAAAVLQDPGADSHSLQARTADLAAAVSALDGEAAEGLPTRFGAVDRDTRAEALTALDPAFRAQELGFATTQVAANVLLTAAAWQRSWVDKILGRQPVGVPTSWASAVERGSAHLRLNSVWLQNSVRGAIGLALAVFIADSSGVQHSFWVVLGALSVLRSNALSTGQSAVRSLWGTVVGFAIGGLVVLAIGTNETASWIVLPLAILVAGFLPAAISFAAGQAAFTVVVLVLFNLLQPSSWTVGLVRVEDVAIGCGVSLLVGILFWPRGAGAELRRAIAGAYTEGIRYLEAAVAAGMARCQRGGPDLDASTSYAGDAVTAAAASRRLDDAYRAYLAERGTKPSSLANVTTLVNGVVAVRLVADAVTDLWEHEGTVVPAERLAARAHIDDASHRLVGWYDALAGVVVGDRVLPPEALAEPSAVDDLMQALHADLTSEIPGSLNTATRMLWTYDYLDALHRHQQALVEPAQVIARVAVERRAGRFGWLR